MAPEGAMAVEGGNWQIFHKMVEKSQATIFFNRSVTAVSLHKPQNPDTAGVKYTLRIDKSDYEEDYQLPFDDVIIANPYQFGKTSFQSGVLETPIDEIPYVQLHVTIFSSPFRYSPAFFGLSDPKDVPGTILTTLGKEDEPISGAGGAGKAGFFSISMLRKVVNPATEKEEYLYKIFSPEKVTPEFLRYTLTPLFLEIWSLTFTAASSVSMSQTRSSPTQPNQTPSARSRGTTPTCSTRTPRPSPE